MEKVGVIIQARMGSTRLPGKVMLDINGKTVLEQVINRVKLSKKVDEIIIATTTLERDEIIAKESNKCHVKSYRGSEEDVLSRYYYAAKENNIDTIVRVTSDCPLIDPFILDEIVDYYQNSNYTMVTNAGADVSNRTYPRGLDVEVFSFKMLEEAFNKATKKHHKEHVTPYIYEKSNNVFYYKDKNDYSKYRWTLDTEEDYKLIKEVYKGLNDKGEFFYKDIITLMEMNPELERINGHIEQKKI